MDARRSCGYLMNRRAHKVAHHGEIGWRATAGSGLLLGCAICLMELVQQPLSNARMAAIFDFVSSLAPTWWLIGLGWAFVARWADERCSLPGFASVWLAAATLLTVATIPVDFVIPVYDHAMRLGPDTRFIHVLWENLFYGALYLTGYVASRRAIRSRRNLARVEQAREEAAAALEESQLQAMRRQLQPQTTLDALAALRDLYSSHSKRADDLVDELVGFLRLAVRSLTADAAFLAGELDLARRYLRLRVLIGGGSNPALPVDGRSPPTIGFPPRLLMSAVEGLSLAGARLVLANNWQGENYYVALTARAWRRAHFPPD